MLERLSQQDLNSVLDDKAELARKFFSAGHSGSRFLLGRNDDSQRVAATVPITGVVDDFAQEQAWRGLPIVRSDQLPADAIVLNCSTSISPVAAETKLASIGKIAGHITIGQVLATCPSAVSPPDFVTATRLDYEQHKTYWASLYESLSDAESQRTLADVVRYRLSCNTDFMRSYGVRLKDQYFEDFAGINDREVFVDGGAFDGETTEELHRRRGGFEKSFLFEPSAVNLEKAKRRLQALRGVVFCPFGLSDRQDVLHFDASSGSASKICSEGTSEIRVTTLDSAVAEPVSFIKLDVEGWEIPALRGAERHILEDHPKLAIAVYHNPSDFRLVHALVLSMRSDYDVYLRHYTQGWSETIMFFIPTHGAARPNEGRSDRN